MVNPTVGGLTLTDFLKLTIPILATICAWLWSQINTNRKVSDRNTNAIALMNQSLQSHMGKVDGMEEEVKKLSNELTQVKFSLQSLEHKQDTHHLELMNAIRHTYKEK